MGVIDEFLKTHVATHLLPGEQILGCGHMRHPLRFNALGVPTIYVHWLAVATSSRLLTFSTDAGGMFGDQPKPKAKDLQVWSYDEIAEVNIGNVEGLNIHSGGQGIRLTLTPRPFCGPIPGSEKPARYDIYPHAEGLDDQRRFQTWFPQWLQQQVSTGAFPMPQEKRVKLEARLGSERKAQAEQSQRKEETRRRSRSVMARVGIGAVLISMAALLIMIIVNSIEQYREYSEFWEDPVIRETRLALEDIRQGKRPYQECQTASFGDCVRCREPGYSYDRPADFQEVKDYKSDSWYCPPTSYYEARLKEVQNLREEALNEELKERQGMRTKSLIYSIFSGVGLLVILVMVWLFIAWG